MFVEFLFLFRNNQPGKLCSHSRAEGLERQTSGGNPKYIYQSFEIFGDSLDSGVTAFVVFFCIPS